MISSAVEERIVHGSNDGDLEVSGNVGTLRANCGRRVEMLFSAVR